MAIDPFSATFKGYPRGAIRSLEVFTDLANESTSILLYEIVGQGKRSFMRCNSVAFFCGNDAGRKLLDRNVIKRNDYNDNFLFDNRMLAEDYMEFCKRSWLQESKQQSKSDLYNDLDDDMA